VRYWAAGCGGIEPLIQPARSSPLVLSFVNLVELHVLGVIRRRHGVALPDVLGALEFVQRKIKVGRPLASQRFETDEVSFFVERFGELVNGSNEG